MNFYAYRVLDKNNFFFFICNLKTNNHRRKSWGVSLRVLTRPEIIGTAALVQ